MPPFQYIASGIADRQEIRFRDGDRRQILCVGITPWENVQSRELIEDEIKRKREEKVRVVESEFNNHAS